MFFLGMGRYKCGVGQIEIKDKNSVFGGSKRKYEKGLFGAGQNGKREACWRRGEVMREIYSAVSEDEYA